MFIYQIRSYYTSGAWWLWYVVVVGRGGSVVGSVPRHSINAVVGRVSRQLVYGHFVYDNSSTAISSTDISSTVTFLAEIEAAVMKRILYQ